MQYGCGVYVDAVDDITGTISLVPRPFYARGLAGKEIRAWYQSFAHA